MKLDFLQEFEFFTGVPDSLLKPLSSYLMDTYGISKQHVIAANEGNAVALAAGYHLATGKVPVVYLQNSGQGNIVNPITSLLNEKVYGIPCLFIVGWRGEPGYKDEPQHVFQGEITIEMFESMNVRTFIIRKDTTEDELANAMAQLRDLLNEGKQVALVVQNGALEYNGKVKYENEYQLIREDIVRQVTEVSAEDIIVSTTGKASRELFEIRESNGQHHGYDFLTVGSMGHSSSIALGIAMQKPNEKIWVIDGDGALLMHMGSMALLGASSPNNIVHIVINNGAHETVGGMPTVAGKLDLVKIAEGCGYPNAVSVHTQEALSHALQQAKQRQELTLIEVKCGLGARDNLGRPTTTARENKENFMSYIANK